MEAFLSLRVGNVTRLASRQRWRQRCLPNGFAEDALSTGAVTKDPASAPVWACDRCSSPLGLLVAAILESSAHK
jgi:hypothetical protein